MKDFFKRNLSLIIMAFLIICLSVILFVVVPDGKKAKGNLLSVDAEKLVLQVSDRLPISDYTASSLDSDNIDSDVLDKLVFSIASPSSDEIDYEIYLSDEDLENSISSEYIKILLTDTGGNNYNVNNGVVPVFSELSGSVRFPGYRKIYSGTLKSGHIKQFVIKMWVSDEYLVQAEGKSFKANLIVKSV